MHAFPIRNDADLHRAVALIDTLWNAEPGSVEDDTLQVMSQLVDAYEARTSTLPPGDPVDIIRFKLNELHWTQNELARRLGWTSGRVSEVLNRRRPLTLTQVRDLSRILDLPAGLLVHDVADAAHRGRWVHLGAERVVHATDEQVVLAVQAALAQLTAASCTLQVLDPERGPASTSLRSDVFGKRDAA
jgi:HTH-type transcriptional regulator/antitoxin HigA